MDELRYWIALHLALGNTPVAAHHALALVSSAKALFENVAHPALKFTSVQQQRLQQINWSLVDKAQQWQTHDRHIITFDDPRYPPLLKHIHDPPLVLYVMGHAALLRQSQLAIVGSRKPTHAGRETAYQIANALAKAGLVITSGLALGIDGCAHRGAVDAEKPTIAVLGCGVDVIYPKTHRPLFQSILIHGAIISEYPLNTAACAIHFPRRNRIITGLSQATLVVEATTQSGSLVSARLAMEQNRDVFAIPGSIQNPQARGCHQLIKQGAALVTDAQDIMNELDMNVAITTPHIASIYRELDSIDTKLLECLGFETRPVQYMIDQLGISAQNVCSRLLKLELRGYIKAVSGGYSREKL